MGDMAVLREDPYGQFNFLVEVGDGTDARSPDGAFSEVSGLDVTIEVVEYRTGNDATNSPRKLNGLAKYGDVSLKRGLIGSVRLWEWIEATIRGSGEAQRSVRITLLDAEREPVMSWTLRNARPVRHVSGPLRGGGSEVAVEELVLAHEGLDIE
jgi:phage tail-like protein